MRSISIVAALLLVSSSAFAQKIGEQSNIIEKNEAAPVTQVAPLPAAPASTPAPVAPRVIAIAPAAPTIDPNAATNAALETIARSVSSLTNSVNTKFNELSTSITATDQRLQRLEQSAAARPVATTTVVDRTTLAQQAGADQVTTTRSNPNAASTMVRTQSVPATADPQATAEKKLAALQEAKRKCFTDAGLEEGVTWRFREDKPTVYQVADKVWYPNSPYDKEAVKKCQ